VMADGHLIASGPPETALAPAVLAQAFGVEGRIAEVDATPVFVGRSLDR
jgi:ABC-type cobalamin transport system ATPase subunit